jgi:hypothetical protein
MGGFITEVMGLVYYYEIIIAPIDMRKVYIPRSASITGKISMIKHIIIKTVRSEEVTTVIGFV